VVRKIGYFKRQHSLFLCQHFDININGIDYHNDFNVGFEFKETWSNIERNKKFRVPLNQVLKAKYFVFCEDFSNFYIVSSEEIQFRYTFRNENRRAIIRLSSVMEIALFHTKNIEVLKKMIKEMIKE